MSNLPKVNCVGDMCPSYSVEDPHSCEQFEDCQFRTLPTIKCPICGAIKTGTDDVYFVKLVTNEGMIDGATVCSKECAKEQQSRYIRENPRYADKIRKEGYFRYKVEDSYL